MAIEGAEAEAEEVYQEEQPQYVGEDQEQALEQDITNFVDTQGKPRFILKPSVTTLSLSLIITTLLMHLS